MGKRILLIDGHGLAFRGFYALPETLTAKDGTPTNAIVGFTNMLLKCIETMGMDSVAIFFDPKGPTVRKEMYKEYKDGRRPTPESFKTQLPIIIDLCKLMGFPVLIKDGIEADDNIISTARFLSATGNDAVILTADKDILQVIDGRIIVMRPTKGVSEFREYDYEYFVKEYGFIPPRMADYLALMGDAVDNIPGVKGIGEKSARDLVSTYGTLENIYENLDKLPKGKRTKLEEGRDDAFRSRELVVPVEVKHTELEYLEMQEPEKDKLYDICTRLGLKKILERILPEKVAELKSSKSPDKKSDSSPVSEMYDGEIFCSMDYSVKKEIPFNELLKYDALSYSPVAEGTSSAIRHLFVSSACEYAYLDVKNEADFNGYNEWCKNGKLYLFGLRDVLVKSELPLPDLDSIRDVEALHYILHPDRGGAAVKKTIPDLPDNDIDRTFALEAIWSKLSPEAEKMGLTGLMNELDMPLSAVLAEIQKNGIYVDREKLIALEAELNDKIFSIECNITKEAGERINLNSPKQVATLLFEHMHLPPVKKTATGFSTDMSVLEELSKLPEPLCNVPSMLIEYREVTKILSGFVHPFLALTDNDEHVIHSTFDHLSTGTGRLSSRDPNVQNLPVFGEWSERFRSCLVPRKGNAFVSADYSQVELRVLAHLSEETRLLEAFRSGRDVHTETASWVFGLAPEDISQEQRRFAKVVNFGLLYGMSAFGLAQRLGVSRPAAAKMVDKYFEAFPSVQGYMKDSIEKAKKAGYTKSVFGRIRPLSELSTIEGRGNNPVNRVSVNTPIQSTASDIAKFALIKFQKELDKLDYNAKIVLQVHDSIVCECPAEKTEEIRALLIGTMESINLLSVPLSVDAKTGFSLNEV